MRSAANPSSTIATREQDHDGDWWVECSSGSASPPMPPVSLCLEPEGSPLKSQECCEKASSQALADGKQLQIKVVATTSVHAETLPTETLQPPSLAAAQDDDGTCDFFADNMNEEEAHTKAAAAADHSDVNATGSPLSTEFVLVGAEAGSVNADTDAETQVVEDEDEEQEQEQEQEQDEEEEEKKEEEEDINLDGESLKDFLASSPPSSPSQNSSIPPGTTQKTPRLRPSLSSQHSSSSLRREAFKKHQSTTSTNATASATATAASTNTAAVAITCMPLQLPCTTSKFNPVLDVVADNLVNVMIKKFGTFDKRKPNTIPEKLAAASRSVNMLKGALSHMIEGNTSVASGKNAATMVPMASAPGKHLNPVLHHLSESVQVYAELVQACLLDHVTEDEGAGASDVLERRKLNKEVEGLVRAAAAASAAA